MIVKRDTLGSLSPERDTLGSLGCKRAAELVARVSLMLANGPADC